MTVVPPPPPGKPRDINGPPEAVIQQIGRWTWLVVIRHGLSQYGPGGYGWHVLGRRRAEKKARRELDRYLLRERRRTAIHVIARGTRDA